MKRIVALVLAFTMVLALGTTAMAEAPTIRFAHMDTASSESMKVITDKLDAYATSVKDKYNLVQEVVAGDELKSKIRIDIASNNMPDIMWFWGTAADASALVANDLVITVDEYFEKSSLSRDNFKDLWDGLTINGGQYCLPVDNLESNWVANKAIFDELGLEIPKTYDELIADSEKLNAAGYIPLAMGSKGGNPAHFFFDMIYYQYPGARDEMLGLGETWNIDTENFRSALAVMQKLVDNKCLPEDTIANGDWGPYFALFTQGKAAVTWGWSGMIQGIPDTIKYELIDPLQVDGTGYDTSKMSLAWCGAGIMINKASWSDPAKQAAIVDFVDWYLGEDFMTTTFYYDGVIPTRKDITYDTSKVNPAVVAVVERNKDKSPYLTHLATIPDANVWVDYQSGMDEFLAGTMSLDDYVAYLQNSMNENKPS